MSRLVEFRGLKHQFAAPIAELEMLKTDNGSKKNLSLRPNRTTYLLSIVSALMRFWGCLTTKT